MGSLLGVKAGLAAGRCVPLEGCNLLLQGWECLEIRGIVKPAMLHEAQEVAYDQGLADVVVASCGVTAGRFAAGEDDGIDLLPGHVSVAMEDGILLEVVPDRRPQSGGIEAQVGTIGDPRLRPQPFDGGDDGLGNMGIVHASYAVQGSQMIDCIPNSCRPIHLDYSQAGEVEGLRQVHA